MDWKQDGGININCENEKCMIVSKKDKSKNDLHSGDVKIKKVDKF